MVTIVNAPPLAFEQIVIEELAAPLADHGFRYVDPPLPKYQNQIVTFARQRAGQNEEIVLQRATYDSEQMQVTTTDDEVEAVPIPYDKDYIRVSRHTLCIHFIVDGATNWLQRNGRAGTGDDYWWQFTDEADLRRLLQELLPMILEAGMRRFEARLEDYQSGYVMRPVA